MMPPYVDGQFPTASNVLEIDGVEYICNSFQTDKSATTDNISNADGEHAGAVSRRGPVTGSAELQLADASTPVPTLAAEDASTGTFTVNTVVYFITAVSEPQPAGQVRVVNIQFQKRHNPV